MTSPLTLVERDRSVLWHPYTQHGFDPQFFPVVSGYGAYLKLEDGREILDGISSWWVNLHGHAHPRIVEAIGRQASKLEHVIFAGFTHSPAVELAEVLLNVDSVKEAGLTRAFFSDNGSTAVEVALKMSFQYFTNQGNQNRDRFLALSDAYHGDTLGAMAVGEPAGFHTQFRKLLPQVDFISPDNLSQLQENLDRFGDRYAAFIFEPLVQGAGGMKMYSAGYLEQAVELCRARGIFAICDEVFTGFYRTGKCFAFEHTKMRPDFVCLSKGITGGFLPLAVTLAPEWVFDAFKSSQIRNAFLHGHSYTANPIACAAALESWKILHEPESQEQIQMISKRTAEYLERFRSSSKVKSVRHLGTIGAIELTDHLDYFNHPTHHFAQFALSRNVLMRPLGNVLYAVPPYCVTAEELKRLYDTAWEWLSIRKTE